MIPNKTLPQPPHNHVLTPSIPPSGLTTHLHLHLPTSISSHLPEKLTHQQARLSSVEAYQSDIAQAIVTGRQLNDDSNQAKLSDAEVAELKTELHLMDGMTEKEKEKWVVSRQTGESGKRRRSLVTGV